MVAEANHGSTIGNARGLLRKSIRRILVHGKDPEANRKNTPNHQPLTRARIGTGKGTSPAKDSDQTAATVSGSDRGSVTAVPRQARELFRQGASNQRTIGETRMRINVYNEELTQDFEFVSKFVEETKKTYYGFRIFLKSAPELHHKSEDDDRSAITMWFGTKQKARDYFEKVLVYCNATRYRLPATGTDSKIKAE
jgi:hypothetical protein